MVKQVRFLRDAYIPFLHDDEEDLAFERSDVELVKGLWTDGWCVHCIAAEIGRDPDMVLVLLIDLGRQGAVRRPAGAPAWWIPCKDCKGG